MFAASPVSLKTKASPRRRNSNLLSHPKLASEPVSFAFLKDL